MAGRRLLGANGKFITPNNKKASVAAVVASNNENLFKLIASEKSHISQVNSATPDFNTVMKNYGTFSNDTYEATLAAEKARVDAFTSMPDDTSQTQLTDFPKNTKLKRKIEAENEIERVQNVKQDLLRQELSAVAPGDDVSRAYDFTKQGEFQPKPVFEEKPSLVLNEDTGIQTTASGERLDAIGREINQTFTNVGQESYVGQNTDELAFEAIEAIKNEEKAVTTEKIEYIDPHKYNRDGKGQIITNTPAHNQLHSEKTAAVVDHSISGNNQKVYAETLKLEADTKDSALQAKQLGDSTELNAEKDAASAVFMSNYNDDQVFNPSFDEALSNEILNTSDKDLKETAAKKINEVKINEAEQKFQQQDIGADDYQATLEAERARVAQLSATADGHFDKSLPPGGRDIKHSDAYIENEKAANENRYEFDPENAESYGQILAEGSEQTANANNEAKVKGLKEQEVLRVERKQAHNLGQDAFSGQGTDAVDPIKNQRGILDRINEERTGGDFEGRQFRQNQDLANSLDAEQKFSEMRNAQDQLISEGPSTRNTRGKFRRLQAEKKAAAAESQSKMPSANGPTRRSSRGHRMKRGDANDPYHFTTLAYPPDAVNSQENGHFMLFYVNVQNKTKYSYNGYKNGSVVPVGDMVSVSEFTVADETNVAPSERTGKLITEYRPGAQAAGIVGPVDYQKQMIRNGGKGNIIYNNQKVLMKGRKSPGQNLASKYPTTTRITDSVALYLPAGIGNTTNVSYGDFETGFAGYLTMSGLDVAKGLQEEDFVGVATDLFGKGGTFITDAIKKLALAGMETLGGGQGLQQNFDKIFGQTLNPYIEVAFNSTGMRTFDYTFKFAPKSKAETDEVQAIIKLFRFHMLPEMKGTSHRYLTLPSTFDIHYMWQNGQTTAKENSFYNKIATCVLTNVDVNYTPNDQVQSFGDGAPTQISMGLSFKETEMMTKQHVNEGF